MTTRNNSGYAAIFPCDTHAPMRAQPCVHSLAHTHELTHEQLNAQDVSYRITSPTQSGEASSGYDTILDINLGKNSYMIAEFKVMHGPTSNPTSPGLKIQPERSAPFLKF